MVMATPSPQQVGREFVRQYYTVLHEAPQVLHRFYSSASTFLHGGVDRPGQTVEEPVVGQLEIDKKIRSLNFKDCHTKIRQVDSQATIGNGVVVQVTGELSNNGEPMRRFMQTFVLAPQTPKKYYVHNDIFRYQDEVYHDITDSESEETISAQQQVEQVGVSSGQQQQQTQKSSLNYYQNNDHSSSSEQSDLIRQVASPLVQQHQQQPEANAVHHDLNDNKEQNLMVNGHHSHPTETESKPVDNVNEITQQINSLEFTSDQHHSVPVTTTKHVEQQSQQSLPISQTSAKETKDESVHAKQEASDAKNSWAQIINRGSGNELTSQQYNQQFNQSAMLNKVGGSGVPSGSMVNNVSTNQSTTAAVSTKPSSNQQQSSQQQKEKPTQNGQTNPNTNSSSKNQKPSSSNRGGPQSTSSSSRSNQQQSQPQSQQPTNGNTSDLEDDKRFGSRYSDGQQVFVGNLSQDLSEAELKQYFGQYGRVLEVRINTNTKQQSGRRLPNYGFVVFEDKQSVDVLLGSSKSNNLTYKNDKGVEFRLNVEEKRARQTRMSTGYGGGKPNNRVARSSSNGSRNGQNNYNNKKNINNDGFVGDKSSNNATNNVIDSNHRNKNNFRRS
jgi:Ras GTPase-activating protein-binding protein 1